MSQNSSVRGVFCLPLRLGAMIWTVLALASLSSRIHIGIIEVLFLFGPWIVVPLGADLIRGAGASSAVDYVRDWTFSGTKPFAQFCFAVGEGYLLSREFG